MSRRTVNFLTGIIVVVLLVILSLFMASDRSVNQAKQETIKLVEVDHKVQKVNKFYWLTNTEATYFSLDFQDEKDQQVYAIVAREGGDIHYFTSKDIISEEDAQAITVADNEDHLKDILQARLGLLDNQPIWEVTFKADNDTMTYYYVDAETGKCLQTITNL